MDRFQINSRHCLYTTLETINILVQITFNMTESEWRKIVVTVMSNKVADKHLSECSSNSLCDLCLGIKAVLYESFIFFFVSACMIAFALMFRNRTQNARIVPCYVVQD